MTNFQAQPTTKSLRWLTPERAVLVLDFLRKVHNHDLEVEQLDFKIKYVGCVMPNQDGTESGEILRMKTPGRDESLVRERLNA